MRCLIAMQPVAVSASHRCHWGAFPVRCEVWSGWRWNEWSRNSLRLNYTLFSFINMTVIWILQPNQPRTGGKPFKLDFNPTQQHLWTDLKRSTGSPHAVFVNCSLRRMGEKFPNTVVWRQRRQTRCAATTACHWQRQSEGVWTPPVTHCVFTYQLLT